MNQTRKSSEPVTRRQFIQSSSLAVGGALAGSLALRQGVFAAGADGMKVALIGCGGRGGGALSDCMEAAKMLKLNLKVVATADAFKDRAEGAGQKYGVPKDQCFGGFDAYKKALAAGPDLVLIATSPNFRPVHYEAAVKAGKHVFMEKPVAVDPPGARRVIAAGEEAKTKGLAVVAGTQRRHQKSYLETYAKLSQGALGRILGGRIWWCGGALWYKERNAGESDADYMVRNWVSFTEMSGDHIVEQHVHNIDIANWYIGRPPVSALGYGGRARRRTGDQFDFFSIELDYGEGVAIHSMCRQVNGTYGRVAEAFTGENGTTWGDSRLQMINAKNITVPEFQGGNPYVIEHYDLLKSILDGKPLNEAKTVAESTMTAIMSRISAYTGQLVRWSELTKSEDSPWYNLTLKPTAEDFEKGPVSAPKDDVVPIPGKA
jgi:myo-inositol 2-dehydrogenase/D-chiro-inositol 1-dehydrogenase